jgi:iron(III) transport system substrate-binding protein
MVNEFQKATGITVAMTRKSSGETFAQIKAEAANPKGDIWWGGTGDPHLQAAEEGLTLDYKSPRMGELQDWAVRQWEASKGRTVGIYAGALGYSFNTAELAKRKLPEPKCWADLAKPEYKDGLVMPSPLYSGAAAYMLSGFVSDSNYGWDFYQKLKDNNTIAVRGNGAVLKSVASGEKPYGVLVDFMAMNAKKKGSPVEFVFPSEGVPAVTEPVAIMKTAKNMDDAKHFVDFILSDEGQKLALSMGYLPAKASVGRPDWMPEGVNVKVMPFDTKAIVERTDADKKKFSELFGG